MALQPSTEIDAEIVASICFRQSMSEVSSELGDGTVLISGVVGLSSRQDAFGARATSVASGKRERVNFVSEVKKSLQAACPQFTFKARQGDDLIFLLSPVERLELLLVFSRQRFYGLGKSFTVSLKLEQEGSQQLWLCQDLFELFGDAAPNQPTVAYQTSDDLRSALAGVNDILARIVPLVIERLMLYLAESPTQIPHAIEVREDLTARDAAGLALGTFGEALAGHDLSEVSSVTDLSHRQAAGPGVDYQGVLRPHGMWFVRYVDAGSRARVVDVQVPFAGPIRRSRVEWPYHPRPQSIAEKWLDSTDAIALAESAGGQDARDAADLFELLLKLIQGESGPVWQVEYLLCRSVSQRCDYKLQIDARTGAVLTENGT